jgi:hypothetical protein
MMVLVDEIEKSTTSTFQIDCPILLSFCYVLVKLLIIVEERLTSIAEKKQRLTVLHGNRFLACHLSCICDSHNESTRK